jgi:alpha-L-fucosidase 2
MQSSSLWAAEDGVVQAKQDMLLWYRQPGVKWLDGMPIGNGYMGGMLFGRVQEERIALNESSFWSGRPHDYNDPNVFECFGKIKDLVFAGKFQEAEKMADSHFWGIPKAQAAFMPIGDLVLKFDGAEAPQNYRRELNMETGVARVTYRIGDSTFTCEVFMSYPDRVMVVRLSSDKPGRISVEARMNSPYLEKVTANADRLVMDGTWHRAQREEGLISTVEGKGMSFETAMQARLEGGKSVATNDALRVEGADAVTLVLTIATSHVNYNDISASPAALCEKLLAGCANKDYATLLQRHEKVFRELMGRVHLNVGDAAMNSKPTDERLAAVRAGTPDPNLEALVFQFGRYILAASSRAGGQPANLQGIWNENVLPSWGSKYGSSGKFVPSLQNCTMSGS